MIDALPEFDAASLYAMCEVGNKNASEQRCGTHVIKEHDQRKDSRGGVVYEGVTYRKKRKCHVLDRIWRRIRCESGDFLLKDRGATAPVDMIASLSTSLHGRGLWSQQRAGNQSMTQHDVLSVIIFTPH